MPVCVCEYSIKTVTYEVAAKYGSYMSFTNFERPNTWKVRPRTGWAAKGRVLGVWGLEQIFLLYAREDLWSVC